MARRAPAAVAALLMAALAMPAALFATTATPGVAEYEALKEWSFGPRAQVPPGGFSWTRDVASWRLASGELRLQRPTGDGAVTGMVFEGRGSFRMEVPDRVELEQLRRFAEDPELERIEVEFEKLVLRTSDASLLAPLAPSAEGPWETDPLAHRLHERWLRGRRGDVDARIVAARRNPGDEILWVQLETERWGWLTFELDSLRHEEIVLWRHHRAYSFLESWVSLDRGEDRASSGRPGPANEAPLDLLHADLEARLLELGRDPGLSTTQAVTFRGRFRAALEIAPRRGGRRAAHLTLQPMAELTAVFDGEGRRLGFLRDATGRRFRTLDDRVHAPDLVVLLPRASDPGERLRLIFEYELDVRNYLPGRFWYPAIGPAAPVLLDPHTVSLQVATREEYHARSMGEGGAERVADGVRTSRWRLLEPVRMATFAFARKIFEERLAEPGLPEVVALSPPLGSATRRRLRRIGGDVAAALRFYGELLDAPPALPEVFVTMIQAGHGQAFSGFLHLAEASAFRPRTGPSERFHAHEVAHLWWGHRVGWASYRDQWLSEGLSNYLALLFLEATHPRGEELYREAVEVYTRQALGSMASSMSPFAQSRLALDNMRAADRIGPIGHGVRAGVGEAPGAYRSQSYDKSVVVLHTLRRRLRTETGGDETFVRVLRDLVRTHDGGAVSTADFTAALARHAPGDWRRFVDQWILSAAIPRWRWQHERLEREPASGGLHRVRLVVEQSGVDEDFRTPVPVRVVYRGGDSEELRIEVAGPSTETVLELRAAPRKIVFNPDNAVLAEVRQR